MSFRGLLIAFAAGALALPAGAQTPDSGAFIIRLGRDTLGVERYVRTQQQLVSEVAYRVPVTRALKLTVQYNDKGDVAWYEGINNRVAGVPNSGPMNRTLITYVGDSALVQVWSDALPSGAKTVASRSDMIPLMVPFYSTFMDGLNRARTAGLDTTTLWAFSMEGPVAYPVQGIKTEHPLISIPGSGLLGMSTDSTGRVLMFDGDQSTFKVDVVRTKWLSLDPYFRRWARIDSIGKSVGFLSPRDTVDEAVGSSAILIDYSRPRIRGRTIFGKLVPFKQVWRTGANAATQIEITQPVKINGVRVEKGKYSLWTIPDRNEWTLIINKQTKQWGTEYDAKQDLLRVPMHVEHLAKPVDRFTIALKQTSPGVGMLTLSWENTMAKALIEAGK